MNHGRLISGGGWLLRRLCTAAESPAKSPNLYRILSALKKTGGSVSETLDNHVMQGKSIEKTELERCVEELRRYRRFQHALEVIEWMEMRKINFSWHNYAVQLDLVSKTKGVVAAEEFFSGLPTPAKNKNTYGALLNCYCKELMKDKALSHFDKMDELGYVSSQAFNTLMGLYMRSGEPQKVLDLVELMKRRSIPLSTFTYHVWMNACASLGDLDGVERVYEEMKTEYRIGWETYSNLAAIYVKVKDFEKAEMMLKELEKRVKPRQRDAYHFLLGHYAATGNLGKVQRVWNSLKSVSPVTNFSYMVMLSTLRRLNDIEGLTKCFKEWEASCVSYDGWFQGWFQGYFQGWFHLCQILPTSTKTSQNNRFSHLLCELDATVIDYPKHYELRYVHYVARRNISTEWSLLERALSPDCVILRGFSRFDGGMGASGCLGFLGGIFLVKVGFPRG
ncbi:pentatricopeptide repeat-containing protein At1g02370, mitochondrial-like [Vigna radiata var. radiata]|uniref:Pentatricopeptide repeat-containing protein At1g02370, mitochondrial-like n=1 Tax=Vigna radiata var. radiata TaxID=3916 RepID=A0A1S3V0Q4_VIGRR|nr:pentatricopeptide repeat-containing protein At1g02370, mitochondrial-like [Vigna radiata var. radiata]